MQSTDAGLALRRRKLLQAGGVALAAAFISRPGRALAADRVLRIGYQKYGTLIFLKGKGELEKALAPLGVEVTWAEFPAGPQLLEALDAGAIDLGSTGEAPPIFAQAAGAPLVYVAHEPAAPRGEAILVGRDSPIRTVADLKGRKVALNKGSNVHYLLVQALAKAGVAYPDIHTAFLTPADGRAAFEQGAVDAWVIWDPFLAAAEAATGARTLTNAEGLAANRQFYIAVRSFADANPKILDVLIEQINALDAWMSGHSDVVAQELSGRVGIPPDILEFALKRLPFGAKPLGREVVGDQQKIADTFFGLRLIPKPIVVSDAVWKAAS